MTYIFPNTSTHIYTPNAVRVTRESLIAQAVCSYFNITYDYMISKGRKRERVQARQIFIYLLRTHTTLSLSAIGKLFVGETSGKKKDHTTIIHACQVVKDLLGNSEPYKHMVEEIESKI